MCSIEESREDSNKMKGTRTTKAEVNFEILGTIGKFNLEKKKCVRKQVTSWWSSTNLEPIEITSINTTKNTILFEMVYTLSLTRPV